MCFHYIPSALRRYRNIDNLFTIFFYRLPAFSIGKKATISSRSIVIRLSVKFEKFYYKNKHDGIVEFTDEKGYQRKIEFRLGVNVNEFKL